MDCAGCGVCCESIRTSASPDEIAENVAIGEKRRRWYADVGELLGRAEPDEQVRRREDGVFLAEHLIPIGEHDPADPRWTYRCTAYDPVGKACTAHDRRPLMCSTYRPGALGHDATWEGVWDAWPGPGMMTLDGGWPLTGAGDHPLGCSYRWDYPPGERGPVVGRLLPLWPVAPETAQPAVA